MRIDAHQHFWRYSPEQYGWIGDGMSKLRRDFLPTDLRAELDAVRIDTCVAVQARQDEEETRWLLSLAEESAWISGVVGWCDLRSDDVADKLSKLAADPRLVGLRHVVQDEPDDDFLLRDDFCRGIAELASRDLCYDLLVYPRQLPAAVTFARRFSELPLILDHLGKPDVRSGQSAAWAESLRELARSENVYVKLSGLVTEADWDAWTPSQLVPYLDTVVEAFGSERIVFGSDWPVCLLATDYAQWHQTLDDWSCALSTFERDALFGGNAARFYRLGKSET